MQININLTQFAKIAQKTKLVNESSGSGDRSAQVSPGESGQGSPSITSQDIIHGHFYLEADVALLLLPPPPPPPESPRGHLLLAARGWGGCSSA